jgi:cell division septal protein FtsQ
MARYSTKIKAKQKPQRSLLPLWLALIGLGLVLAAGWAFLGNSQSKANIEVKGSPRLKVEQDAIDHGDVKLGNSIIDTVRITNVGDQPLRFSETPYVEVKEGC